MTAWRGGQSAPYDVGLSGVCAGVDTDIVVQCSAAEVLRRFEAAATPLLVGAEHGWWPNHDPVKGRNPYPDNPAGGPLRYPNSGMLLGTRAGFERLVAQISRPARYPCCPRVYRGEESHECWIDDQACLLAALQRGEMRDHSLVDVGAELLLAEA